MKVSTVKIWPVSGGSALKAKADITFITDLGEVSMKGFRLVQSPGKEPFVGPPQERYTGKDGKSTYKDIIWMSQTFQNAVFPEVIKQYVQQQSSDSSESRP